ncbi:hypothetical protein PROPEN_00519 [Proteus penneri ATCC 35198]|nr:hypothetical protein PROPEN_00519 [Proteus penneri ATCC 35198]
MLLSLVNIINTVYFSNQTPIQPGDKAPFWIRHLIYLKVKCILSHLYYFTASLTTLSA